nr:MAG TPA: hypothetical protein [Caudoviricetes sp.]
MSGVALGISAAAAVAGVAVSANNANKQRKAADRAARLQQHENEVNRANQMASMRQANQQQADLDGILDANTGADNGATLLTGGLGVDKSKLNLGKGSTLLGG